MNRTFHYWKSIAWSVAMLIIFLLPANNLSKTPSFSGLSEMVHIFVFAVFTWFLVLDQITAKLLNSPLLQNYIFAIIIAVLFGLTIEMLQKISGFGRTAEFLDLVYDFAGSFLSTGLIILYFRIRRS